MMRCLTEFHLRKASYLLAVLLSLAVTIAAQSKQEREHTKPEAQRLATDARSFPELFTKLERDLGTGARNGSRSGLEAILAPEFIERSASDPGHPTERTQWIENKLTNYRLDPVTVRDMTIRAFLTNAVVSFVQSETSSPTKAPRQYLIVDLWVVRDGQWQLATRFLSKVTGPPAP